MAPHGIYPCTGDDNWIAISCRHNEDWAKLANLISEPWCTEYADWEKRWQHQDALDRCMETWTQTRDKYELQEALRDILVPVAAVQKPAERIDRDPTTARFGLWPEIGHTEMGEVRVDGKPVHFSETDWQLVHGAPCLGEHNEQVLEGLLGMSETEVESLRAEGVI